MYKKVLYNIMRGGGSGRGGVRWGGRVVGWG